MKVQQQQPRKTPSNKNINKLKKKRKIAQEWAPHSINPRNILLEQTNKTRGNCQKLKQQKRKKRICTRGSELWESCSWQWESFYSLTKNSRKKGRFCNYIFFIAEIAESSFYSSSNVQGDCVFTVVILAKSLPPHRTCPSASYGTHHQLHPFLLV